MTRQLTMMSSNTVKQPVKVGDIALIGYRKDSYHAKKFFSKSISRSRDLIFSDFCVFMMIFIYEEPVMKPEYIEYKISLNGFHLLWYSDDFIEQRYEILKEHGCLFAGNKIVQVSENTVFLDWNL